MSIMSNLHQVITEMIYDQKTPEEIVEQLGIDESLVYPILHEIMFEERPLEHMIEDF